MAVYTILTNAALSNSSTVVIEFPVPAGNNTAGVPWRTIVKELRTEARVGELRTEVGSANPHKASNLAHVALLDAGEVMEIMLTVAYDAKLSDDEKFALLDAAVEAEVARFNIEFKALHKFYGTERGS